MRIRLVAAMVPLLLLACADSVPPESMGIDVTLPRLRVAGDPGWREEPALLLLQADEGSRWPTVEEIDAAGGAAAFLLCADGQGDAWPTITNAFRGAILAEHPRIYFAGLDARSGVDALPMVVDPSLEDELTRVGGVVAPDATHPRGTFVLRITRGGDGVRYRWRRLPVDPVGPVHWDLGDVTLPVAEVEAAGSGPLLPALAKNLGERFEMPEGPRALVAFELGRGVKTVDFLRALECGSGSRQVCFVPIMTTYSEVVLTRVDLPVPPAAGEGHLTETAGADGRVLVNLGPWRRSASDEFGAPTFVTRGERCQSPEEITYPPSKVAGLILRVDREMPFRLWEPVVRRAESEDWLLSLSFAGEDPNFLRERTLPVPIAPSGAPTLDLELARIADSLATVRGCAVTLRIPPATKSGEVFRAALSLVASGAAGVRFVPGP